MDHPGRWLDAVDACKQAGLTYNARDNYKKDMYPDAPKEIKPYLSAKNMEFSYSSFDMNRINSPSLIDEFKLAFDLAKNHLLSYSVFRFNYAFIKHIIISVGPKRVHWSC